MKKTLSILLALCLLLSSALALAESDAVKQIHVGRYVESTWEYPQGDSLENNAWSRDYLNNLGIEIVYDWTVMSSEYTTKLNLAIASGDIPDVLFVENLTQLKTLVEAGMVADISEVYEQYATEKTRSILNGDGGDALNACSIDGGLYALPYMDSTFYEPSVLWVRQDWLDNLGLEAPKTMEEVHAVAKAFTENDPDGNGQNDTYGLAFSNDLFGGAASLVGFFNGFHAYPQTWLTQEDGSISYGSTQPEMKTALKTLAQMYAEGLLDSDFAIKDTTKVCEEVQGMKAGMMYGRNWAGYSAGTAADKWSIIPSPSHDDQETQYSVSSSWNGYFVVSSACAYPEALVQMMNEYCDLVYGDRRSEDGYIYVTVDGKSIQQSQLAVVRTSTPDSLTIEAVEALVRAVDARDESLLADAVTETDKYAPSIAYLDEGDTTYFGQYYQYIAFKLTAEEIGMDRLVKTAYNESTETMDAKWSILKDYEIEMFTKIIMGEEPIDAFDTFASTWLGMGGDVITAEVNEIVG